MQDADIRASDLPAGTDTPPRHTAIARRPLPAGISEQLSDEAPRLLDELHMRDDTLARMRTTAESIAQASGAKAELKFAKPGYSATVNDENLTARMLPTLQQVTGGKAVVAPKLSASEDFSEFQKKAPGMFFFLGSTDPKRDLKAAAPNHSPKFEIDEASLAVGARAMTALALDYLAQP